MLKEDWTGTCHTATLHKHLSSSIPLESPMPSPLERPAQVSITPAKHKRGTHRNTSRSAGTSGTVAQSATLYANANEGLAPNKTEKSWHSGTIQNIVSCL